MNKTIRLSKRGAVIFVALITFATPAFAAVIIQNFMAAEVDAATPCFVKEAGGDIALTDGGVPLTNFSANPATDTVIVDGVTLLEERITIRGMIGDRVTYTDAVRYTNNCDFAVQLDLINVNATSWVAGNRAEFLVANSPVGTLTNETDLSGTNRSAFGGAGDWNNNSILITAAGTGAGPGGPVTIASGETFQGAVIVSIDATTANGTNIGEVTWIAQATNV